jgi:hypothetical protein
MSITSTYDHRVIQGAESGQFLARIHALLLGEDRFYDQLFGDFQIPYEPFDGSGPTILIFGTVAGLEQIEKQRVRS